MTPALAALFLAGVVSAASAPVVPTAPAVRGADEALLAEVRRVGARVAALRGSSFDRPPLAVRAPEDLRQAAAVIRARGALGRERLAARGRAFADLGLGDEEAPERLLARLADDLPGVALDPAGRLFVDPARLSARDFAPGDAGSGPSTVLLWTGMRPDEPLVAHMLAHLGQRQRLGRDTLESTTDALLARAAWAEGEANLVALLDLFGGLGLGRQALESRIGPGDVLDGALVPPGLAGAPGIEGRLLRFVYLDGFAAALERLGRGGFAALDAALGERVTTSQVLHPAREVVPAVPPPPVAEAGFEVADVDTVGEQAIVALIAEWTGKDSLGLQAGDGWAGDRLARLERPAAPEAGRTEWLTRWESADHAAEFEYAWGRSIQARFPQAAALPSAAAGEHGVVAGSLAFRWGRQGSEVRVRVAAAVP